MGSPLRKLLSEEILKLAETDYFIGLKQKWWKADKPCPVVMPPSEEMGLTELVGVFLVLLAGCIVGVIMMFGEFLWEATYIPFGERVRTLGKFEVKLLGSASGILIGNTRSGSFSHSSCSKYGGPSDLRCGVTIKGLVRREWRGTSYRPDHERRNSRPSPRN